MKYKNISYKDIQAYCNNFFKWILKNKKNNFTRFNINELFLEYTEKELINKKEIDLKIEEIIKKSDFYIDFLDSLYKIFSFTCELFKYCELDISKFKILGESPSNVLKLVCNKEKSWNKNGNKFSFTEYIWNVRNIFYSEIWIKIFVSEFIIELLNEEKINIDYNKKLNIHSAFLDIIINSQFSNDKNKKYIILNHRILIEHIFGKKKEITYQKLKEYIISFSKDKLIIKEELELINNELLEELELINNELLEELEVIDIELLVEIFNLPIHYYHFPTKENEKQLLSTSNLLENILFKNCFFDSPILFWTHVLTVEMNLNEIFKNKIKEWNFLEINNQTSKKDLNNNIK